MKPHKFLATLAILVLTACGTFAVGVEHPTATLVPANALATDNVRIEALVVASATAIWLTAQAALFSATPTPTDLPEIIATTTVTPLVATTEPPTRLPSPTSPPWQPSATPTLTPVPAATDISAITPPPTQMISGESLSPNGKYTAVNDETVGVCDALLQMKGDNYCGPPNNRTPPTADHVSSGVIFVAVVLVDGGQHMSRLFCA